jgi:hypothetical protein
VYVERKRSPQLGVESKLARRLRRWSTVIFIRQRELQGL